jgi:hypothetical protein
MSSGAELKTRATAGPRPNREIERKKYMETIAKTMRETLLCEQSGNDSRWHLTDCEKFAIGSFETLAEAKQFAVQNNYRLHIFPANSRPKWFNPA